MSNVTGPQAIEELTNEGKRLKDSITATQQFISQRKEQQEKSLLVQSIEGTCDLMSTMHRLITHFSTLFCFVDILKCI